jgi:hypothetical protein
MYLNKEGLTGLMFDFGEMLVFQMGKERGLIGSLIKCGSIFLHYHQHFYAIIQ